MKMFSIQEALRELNAQDAKQLNEDANSLVDQDGDVEDISFSLYDYYKSEVEEGCNEGCDKQEVKEEEVVEETAEETKEVEQPKAKINRFADQDGDVEDRNFNLASDKLNEDLEHSFPVKALPEADIVNYIKNIPVAQGIQKDENGNIIAKAKPVSFFKLGYFKELKDVAAKYRGGRGSRPEDPKVRVFKATEYSKLYTGASYEDLKSVKAYRADSGVERKGERAGMTYNSENAVANKIGVYANGDKVLQAYLANNCKVKSTYYISIDGGDLKKATNEEVAQYLTPASARDLLNPTPRTKTKEITTNAETGEEVVTFNPQLVNRLKLSNIYMIGNLGSKLLEALKTAKKRYII